MAAERRTGKRVLVTGGAGEMGAHACRVLAGAEEIAEVLVADRNEAAATALADVLGPRAKPLALDISDAAALASALSGIDIVLNTTGPFYRFGPLVLRAAIAAGTHYLDICDDFEPTLEMLGLDAAAREAGVTAVIGVGASPGISNLLGVLAMNECDAVETVYTSWRASGFQRAEVDDSVRSSAAVEHWLHNCTATIKAWRDGGLADTQPLEERTLSYPGRGEATVWVCGHPEPLTLPRSRSGVRESLNLMTSRPRLMEAVIRTANRVRSGELDVAAASRALVLEPGTMGSAAGPAPSLPVLFAVAEGTKDGKRIRVGARPLVVPDDSMGTMTGIPLAVATLMTARGQGGRPGVHGPEVLDARTFFADLAQHARQAPGNERPADVVEVVVEEITAR
ncbi:saccharopine dehydrogenase family protein [Amycolatopsis dendrobii]|uniref:Saccharopine dehydrogenase NADP-binding domain-containing protein n=1 Tax=Amycolatopsis dendrobii TaxID=2760662 RepID=A0A7W3ZFC9_9PSEU|nr:saccharopine dehydrogenase NADP-binding domain-containing protein [Amycolatopsis dendrobii]MBB1158967.1 saccharopine dehydrogenase NADP-binding domain-containing protein [Amycolatopsis dendrobii]